MEFLVREVQRGVEFNDGHTDEKSLGKLLMDSPDTYVPSVIYLWGQDSKSFPITTLTEGQFGGVQEVTSVLYDWKVAGRARYADEVANFDSSVNSTPGIGGSPFYVDFKTQLIIEQYGLIAPDGTQYRVMEKPKKNSNGSYRYLLQPKNPTITCSLTNLVPGKFWVMSAPTIPEAYSRGNRDNKRGLGKMYNQIGFQRYSMEIGGNIANKVVSVQFPVEGGGTTNLWINEQHRQFEKNVLKFSEGQQWTSQFNRQLNGEILLKDLDNGEEIPEGAGVFEMVREVNDISYGASLPLSVINRALESNIEQDSDTGTEIVLYAGRGYLEDFNRGIRTDITASGFTQALGDKMINGEYGKLSYGNTFTQFRNVAGDIITIKPLDMLDNGLLAENDKLNGNIHPISGRPMSSHTAIWLDQSVYSGERNVSMAMQKGLGDTFGIVKGLAPIPAAWGSLTDSKALATEVDASSYQRKLSKGVNILNTTGCVFMQSVI
jgi:hypothetical protein